MSIEANKDVIRFFVEDVINIRNLNALAKAFATDCVFHIRGFPEPLHGIEAYKELLAAFLANLPGLLVKIEDLIAEADKVALRRTWAATYRSQRQGIGPTGMRVTFTGTNIFRLADEQIVEAWLEEIGGILQVSDGESSDMTRVDLLRLSLDAGPSDTLIDSVVDDLQGIVVLC